MEGLEALLKSNGKAMKKYVSVLVQVNMVRDWVTHTLIFGGYLKDDSFCRVCVVFAERVRIEKFAPSGKYRKVRQTPPDFSSMCNKG